MALQLEAPLLTYHYGNHTIISRWVGERPAAGADREIRGGPLYPAEDVRAVLSGAGLNKVSTWTRKCLVDAQKLSFGTRDIGELVEFALRHGRYLGSEWCEQKSGGPWAACDAYSLIRREKLPHTGRELDVEYYIKFAISRTGNVILVASCHPPEDRS